MAIAFYFVFWRIVPTLALLTTSHLSNQLEQILSTLAAVATELLLLTPFLRSRFGGTRVGWLHPLILPTVISIVFGLLKYPQTVLLPVSVWSQLGTSTPLLLTLHNIELVEAQLKLNLLNLLALGCTYAGFSLGAQKGVRTLRPVRIDGTMIVFLFSTSVLVTLFFLQRQGGVIEHMASLAYGRFRMRELNGPFLVVVVFMPYLLVLWYAYRPSALRNPIFILALLASMALQFVVTGSRSSTFKPVALMLAVWLFHHRRLPAIRSIVLGIIAILLLGVLGEIRNSGRNGEIDISALTNADVSSAWESTQAELEARDLGTNLVVVGLVPRTHDYLYGATYISAVAFWIPRSVWRDKPRGGGAYAAALLFNRRPTMEGYEGTTYPISGVAEAYWNFGVPGVLAIFAVFGVLLRRIGHLVIRNPKNPFALVVLLAVAFNLPSPATTSLVPVFQLFVLLYLTFLLTTKLRLRS